MKGRLAVVALVITTLIGCWPVATHLGETAVGARIARADEPHVAALATPEEVLRQLVENAGQSYAGPCVAARSPEDAGKVCATFVAEQGDVQAYLIGRTFSEYGEWVFLRHTAAGWDQAGAAALDFFATELRIPWPR